MITPCNLLKGFGLLFRGTEAELNAIPKGRYKLTEGDLWYDSANDVLKMYDGSAWVEFTADADAHASSHESGGEDEVDHGNLAGISDYDHDQYLRKAPRVSSDAAGDITPNSDSVELYIRTGLTGDIAVNADTGTPVQGRKLIIRLKDNGTGRAVAWNAQYRSMGATLPNPTTASKTVYVGLIYNSTDSKWDCVAVSEGA